MEPAGGPWQAIAVAVCMLGLAVSGCPPLAEGLSPLLGEDACPWGVCADERTGYLLTQPAGEDSDFGPIERFLYRLREYEEPFPCPVDLTWPSLILDPCVLTEGMDLTRLLPVSEGDDNTPLPEPVLVLVFGDACEPGATMGSVQGTGQVEGDASIGILRFLEMAVSSDTTRVLYCDPALITGPDMFLVLSPVQSGPVTLQP